MQSEAVSSFQWLQDTSNVQDERIKSVSMSCKDTRNVQDERIKSVSKSC